MKSRHNNDARGGADHGPAEQAAAMVLEDIAIGTRGTIKRARRRDNLDGLDLDVPSRQALKAWRQAAEHVQAGRGLGPMPWGRDLPPSGATEALPPQVRAITAAEWFRRGTQAAGATASPVLHWVVLAGGTLAGYDATRRWRKGRAMQTLAAAAARMAAEYGLA